MKTVHDKVLSSSMRKNRYTTLSILLFCMFLGTMVRGDDLYRASASGRTETVERLIGEGADVNAVDTTGWKVYTKTEAYAYSSDEATNPDTLLFQRVEGRVANGTTAIYLAAANGHAEVVQVLLDAGADANASTRLDGWTPLLMATNNGHKDVVKQLLNAGAETHARLGLTPLLIAARNGHAQIVQLLIDTGADVNERGRDGATALHMAAYKGDKDICKMLLDANADVNITLDNGTTPLFIATAKGHEEVVKLLRDAGAK